MYTQATQSNKSSQGNFGKGQMSGGKDMPSGMPGRQGISSTGYGGKGMPSGGQGSSRPSNFAIIPAIRASKLKPIEVLKYE